MSIDFIRTQSPIGGGGFLSDPFLDLNGASTTPAISKSTKLDSSCVSNGALAGAIIGTLILSTFTGFLIWLIYLRPKFQELNYKLLHNNQRQSNTKQQINDGYDHDTPQLPLDVTDYKFGTFPFRHSQISNLTGHYNRIDRLNRISSSFRSVNMDKDFEMIDIELLEPTFSGLNFSITGNMRAGIFVKEILNKGQIKTISSNQLKSGDRIMALTVCFESIVYEDALTILSYASPYPVILRIQRPINHIKVHVTNEKRPTIVNNKVKWRDDFEHYDNDSSRSYIQPNRPPLPPPTTINSSKLPCSSPKTHPSSKKANTQLRLNNKSSTTTTTINKGNKIKTSSNSVLATSGATIKHSNNDLKKQHQIKTNLISKSPIKTSISTTKKPPKSVADAVISYLHYKGAGGEHATDIVHHSEATTTMPYYDSPYDYYYGGQVSQYQYLNQSHLNKNNNNSLSAETLTIVTPNLATSVYTLHLSSKKSLFPNQRRCERRLSSPAIINTTSINERTLIDNNENIINNIDTFV